MRWTAIHTERSRPPCGLVCLVNGLNPAQPLSFASVPTRLKTDTLGLKGERLRDDPPGNRNWDDIVRLDPLRSSTERFQREVARVVPDRLPI